MANATFNVNLTFIICGQFKNEPICFFAEAYLVISQNSYSKIVIPTMSKLKNLINICMVPTDDSALEIL